MRKIITFAVFAIMFLTVLMCSGGCTQHIYVTDAIRKFTVACDSVTVNDSTWMQPVTFRFKGNEILHTNFFQHCNMHIMEKSDRGMFVRASCNEHIYLVQFNLCDGGYIRFTHPDRIISFHILNIVEL